jgi:hypothetical protein
VTPRKPNSASEQGRFEKWLVSWIARFRSLNP